MPNYFRIFLFYSLIVGSGFSQETVKSDTVIFPRMIFIERGDSSYYMDKYEVTNGEYAQFLNDLGNQEEEGAPWIELRSRFALIEESESGKFVAIDSFDTHPAVEISWHGAKAYCEWAGKRLPTQSEWRFGCQGRDSRKYPWGKKFIEGYANIYGHKHDGYVRTAPVGTYPLGASPFGLLDMSGNVWEWTYSEGDLQFCAGALG